MRSETHVDEAEPEAVLAGLEARARRVETPCGDGTMAWRIWGEGEPLVLVHGGQGTWSHWIRNIDALAQERMIIAPDLPGHGDSAMPVSEDHVGLSDPLARGLREILGERLPVDMCGFSFGGVVLGHMAALHPGIARRLILIGCGGLDTPNGEIRLQRVAGLEGEERRAVLKSNLLGLMLHHPETVDDLAIHTLLANARTVRIANTRVAELVLPDRLLRVLPRIAAPIDAIWGEHDRPHPDPALQEAALRSVQPDADFRVVAGSGHWVPYERAESFNRIVLDMLSQPLRPVS